MKRYELLTDLVYRFNYQSYLEIGVQNSDVNFNKVDEGLEMRRIGVDPDPSAEAEYPLTSDVFFEEWKMGGQAFDLIFIDGLHHADQVYRDMENSLRHLSPVGTIVVHDCKPRNYAAQVVPRTQVEWNGDVWRGWCRFRAKAHEFGIEMFVLDTDDGCGIIRRGTSPRWIPPTELTYEGLVEEEYAWLNLHPVSMYEQLITR